MVLISVLIKMFGIQTMVSITSKTEIETKTRKWKTPWTRSLTCLCLSTLGLGLFWSEQAHDASLCTLVDLIMAMASPTCFKITGHGRSSQLEGHSPERNPEKRWLGGHLPKMPTPSETINLTTHHPDKKIHTDTTVDAYPANLWCVCHLIAVVVLAPLIQPWFQFAAKWGSFWHGVIPPASHLLQVSFGWVTVQAGFVSMLRLRWWSAGKFGPTTDLSMDSCVGLLNLATHNMLFVINNLLLIVDTAHR